MLHYLIFLHLHEHRLCCIIRPRHLVQRQSQAVKPVAEACMSLQLDQEIGHLGFSINNWEAVDSNNITLQVASLNAATKHCVHK